MIEQDLGEQYFPKEVEFDPQIIAQILRSRAERPSAKIVQEVKEIGIDLTKENVWEVFLFDESRRIEGHLMLYPDRREVAFHTRIRLGADASLAIGYSGLGFLRLVEVTNVFCFPRFGHVRFESPVAILDVYHGCDHNFVTKKVKSND